jgi:Holliday junction resolvasome RuvABC endonuclease subunit
VKKNLDIPIMKRYKGLIVRMTRYLYALDLSIECSGLVIFDLDTFQHVLMARIPTNANDNYGRRLHQFRSEVVRLGKPYPPNDVAAERIFSFHNTATQVLGRVHGVSEEIFHNYPYTVYPPNSVKLAVSGQGNASKEFLRDAILAQRPDIQFADLNVSDAYGVGITHLIAQYGMLWTTPEKPIKPKKPRKKKVE